MAATCANQYPKIVAQPRSSLPIQRCKLRTSYSSGIRTTTLGYGIFPTLDYSQSSHDDRDFLLLSTLAESTIRDETACSGTWIFLLFAYSTEPPGTVLLQVLYHSSYPPLTANRYLVVNMIFQCFERSSHSPFGLPKTTILVSNAVASH